MNKYISHFITITKHKIIVMFYCFKLGIYKRGLLHDLSKYSITEFFSSARYFQGNKSPIEAEKIDKGYSIAWQHHKGHNPHHWEYWIDNVGTKQNNPIRIPREYVLELICDWIGAGKVYNKDKWTNSTPIEYYNKVRSQRIIHEETDLFIREVLISIRENGIDKTFKYIKQAKFIYK